MADRIKIGVQTDAGQAINKLKELGREVDSFKKKLADLQKQSGRSPSVTAPSTIPTPYGNMPLAGSIVPPRTATPFAALSHVKGGMPPAALSRAGSGSSPVMWGPAFRASMHQMMPGHYAHQTGAAAALAQLQGKPTTAAAATSTTATSPFTRLTSAIDRLTSALTKPKTATISPTSATAALNPFVTLQSQSGELQALQAVTATSSGSSSANLFTPKSVNYAMGPIKGPRIQRAYANLVNNMAQTPAGSATSGRGSATMRRIAHLSLMRSGVPYDALAAMDTAGMSMGGMLALGGAVAGVGLVGGYLASNIMGGYNTYQQSAPTASNMWHTLASGGGYNALYSRITGLGQGVGISNLQAIQSAQLLAGTGGNAAISNGSLGALFGGAVGLGYGANGATTLAQQLAELQRLGITSGLSATATNRSAVFGLGNATIAGGMQGRTNSLMTGITNLIQTLDQQRTTAPNFAKLLGMMTTMSKSGLQALQGSRGANMLSTFNSALTNPGGGPAGQLFMYNALTSGTNLSPFGEMYLAQQGLTGSYGGQTNLQRVMQYATKMFPSLGHLKITKNAKGQASIGMPTNQNQLTGLAYVSGVFGMSMPQTQALMAQFVHNGKFSMSNMNAESQWWQNNFGGMPKSTSMAVAAAQLFNANSYKSIKGVMGTMQSGGFATTANQAKLLAQARGGNTHALNALKKSLGQEMMNGKLLTAEDQLIKAMNDSQATWANIGKKLTPLVNELYNLNNMIGKIVGTAGNIPGLNPSATDAWLAAKLTTGKQNPRYPSRPGITLSKNGGATSYPGANTVSGWSTLIKRASAKYGLPPALIAAVMQHESSGNPNAKNVNTNGTIDAGLMQINSVNWKGMGLKNPYNPSASIMAGASILAGDVKKYGIKNGLAAYNGGSGGMYGSAEQHYAAVVEGIYQAFQKKGAFAVHVHVHSNNTNLGLEQWSIEQRAITSGGFP